MVVYSRHVHKRIELVSIVCANKGLLVISLLMAAYVVCTIGVSIVQMLGVIEERSGQETTTKGGRLRINEMPEYASDYPPKMLIPSGNENAEADYTNHVNVSNINSNVEQNASTAAADPEVQPAELPPTAEIVSEEDKPQGTTPNVLSIPILTMKPHEPSAQRIAIPVVTFKTGDKPSMFLDFVSTRKSMNK